MTELTADRAISCCSAASPLRSRAASSAASRRSVRSAATLVRSRGARMMDARDLKPRRRHRGAERTSRLRLLTGRHAGLEACLERLKRALPHKRCS